MSDRRWRDGSEDRIVSVLRSASDRSSASDELAAHIDDWPTRYHFGRARTNLPVSYTHLTLPTICSV